MGTFRDDMVRAGQKLRETVEQRTGRQVVETEKLELLESANGELRMARRLMDQAGWELLNYSPESLQSGGFEMRKDLRRFAAQQSLAAWLDDPMAAQAIDLYLSFVLGSDVPRPRAVDPEAQKWLDKTWDDAMNKLVLTGFQALSEKVIDFCLQSTVAFTFFDQGHDGIVRTGLIPYQDLEGVRRHPLFRVRVLYVEVIERQWVWDEICSDYRPAPNLPNRRCFYEAYGAFDPDNPVMAAMDENLATPPQDLIREGKVLLLTANKTTEMAFGVPRMRRLIEWYNDYQTIMRSHVKRMKAMASIYMKLTADGNDRDLERLGRQLVGRASSFDGARNLGEPAAPPSWGMAAPGVAGVNGSANIEPFKIDSGASDLAASAPIVRGQISGPWPDHFMSGTADGALAGAQSLDLPTMKFVEREQELWRTPLVALGEGSLRKAVELGFLSEWRDPTQAELERIQGAEEDGTALPFEVNDQGQIKRDLTFTVDMPQPLQRMLTDIVTAAVATATGVDPNGTNPEMSRWLFATVLRDGFGIADPMQIVDEVLPRKSQAQQQADQQQAMADQQARGIDPATGQPIPQPGSGVTGVDGDKHPADNPGGVAIKAPQPEERPIKETAHEADAFANLFSVAEEHLAALDALPPLVANGNGAHA